LFQLSEQGGQLFAQEAHLFAHGVLAGRLFLGTVAKGEHLLGKGTGEVGTNPRRAQFRVQYLLLPFLL
jgi:hypothetical protein